MANFFTDLKTGYNKEKLTQVKNFSCSPHDGKTPIQALKDEFTVDATTLQNLNFPQKIGALAKKFENFFEESRGRPCADLSKRGGPII